MLPGDRILLQDDQHYIIKIIMFIKIHLNSIDIQVRIF